MRLLLAGVIILLAAAGGYFWLNKDALVPSLKPQYNLSEQELLEVTRALLPDTSNVTIERSSVPMDGAYESRHSQTQNLQYQVKLSVVGSSVAYTFYISPDYLPMYQEYLVYAGPGFNAFVVAALQHQAGLSQAAVDCSAEAWCNYENAPILTVQ